MTEVVDKKAKLREAFKKMNKSYGDNSVGVYGEMPKLNVEAVSTGSLGLDMALGVGGFARGRIIEIMGLEASSKTTICLEAIAALQKKGGTAAFIDMEYAMDPTYAENLGVDMSSLIFSQPNSAEDALEIVENLANTGAVDLIIVDSVATLVPKAEVEGEMGKAQMGSQAKLLSQAMRKLIGPVSRNNVALVFINQIRMKIGVLYGNPETTPGGKALGFAASQRIEVRKIKMGDNDDGEGNAIRVRCKVTKNKVAPPFRSCEYNVIFGQGIDKIAELVDVAAHFGVIEKSKAWINYGGVQYHGKAKFTEALKEDEDLRSRVEASVRLHLGGAAALPVEETEEVEED